MPRRHLGAARLLVREHCARAGISYHETSVVGSYREILAFMSSLAKFSRSEKVLSAKESLRVRVAHSVLSAKQEIERMRARALSAPSLTSEQIDAAEHFVRSGIAKLESMHASAVTSMNIKRAALKRMQKEAQDLLNECRMRLRPLTNAA